MKTLVTGANGLVGRALCSLLDQTNDQVVRTVRTSTTPWEIPVGDLNDDTDWSEALGQNTDVVVHLAGQVPLTDGASSIPGNLYSQVNTMGTTNLAQQCVQYGVKRFIFISTVKVLGEGKDEPYRDTDLAVTADAYAISRWHAKKALWRMGLGRHLYARWGRWGRLRLRCLVSPAGSCRHLWRASMLPCLALFHETPAHTNGRLAICTLTSRGQAVRPTPIQSIQRFIDHLFYC